MDPNAAIEALRNHVTDHGLQQTAATAGLDPRTVQRVLDGGVPSPRTIAALDRIKPRVRTSEEFRGVAPVTAPPLRQETFSWGLDTIRRARDDQMRGTFERPVRMAEAMRTDDALFIPWRNRITALSSIATELVAADGARGEVVARKAPSSVFVPGSVLADVQSTLANHGLAVGQIQRETDDAGTRVDFRLTEWPLENVFWRTGTTQGLYTHVYGGPPVPIVHGDGQWVVFRKFHSKPWTKDAALLSAALVWAAHSNGLRDWAKSAKSHGLAKIMGELQAGTSLATKSGTLSPDAAAFLKMLLDINAGDAGVGIRPAGSKTEFITNNSSAWQVFKELIEGREKVGARVYLGTDAILGSVGGAPGVDIAALFQIASTILQSDAKAIEQGLRTGLYEPWAAVNFGDSQYAPSLRYRLPDPDAAQKKQQDAAAYDSLMTAIEREKSNGMTVDQARVDELAKRYGVQNPPKLAPVASVSVPIALAPADVAKVVRVSEARRAQGLEPFNDERDNMTITELDALAAANAAAKAAAAAAPPAAPTPAPEPTPAPAAA